MAYSVWVLIVLLAMGLLALRTAQSSRLRRVALQRVGLQVQDTAMPALVFFNEPTLRTYPPRYRYGPALAGLLVAGLVRWLTNLPVPYSVAGGIVIAAVTYLLEIRLADSRMERIESQLADAIDLMVASLRAGSALLAALEATLMEAR